MLIFFILSILCVFLIPVRLNLYRYLIFSFFFLFLFLSFFQAGVSSILFFRDVICDRTTLFMVLMLLTVMYICLFFTHNLVPSHVLLSFFFLFLFSYYVFSSTSLFLIYLSYEASLVPILYVILKWGSYPERSLRSFMLLSYTALCTFPFVCVL